MNTEAYELVPTVKEYISKKCFFCDGIGYHEHNSTFLLFFETTERRECIFCKGTGYKTECVEVPVELEDLELEVVEDDSK